MKPRDFREATRRLTEPLNWSPDDCGVLPVFYDGKTCLSSWEMTWRERLSALLFGRVWLWVYGPGTQPPVSLEATRTPFKGEQDG